MLEEAAKGFVNLSKAIDAKMESNPFFKSFVLVIVFFVFGFIYFSPLIILFVLMFEE